MIILPSTTRVSRRLPKEAFYRRLKLDPKQKEEFVQIIDRVTVRNSIKASTVNVEDSAEVQEILVLIIELKREIVPILALEVIAKNNPHKLIFDCRFEDNTAYAIYRSGEVWTSQWFKEESNEDLELRLIGGSLTKAWDSYCAQLLFDKDYVEDVESKISKSKLVRQLDFEIVYLERQHGKEMQTNRRNELFGRLRAALREREELMKEL